MLRLLVEKAQTDALVFASRQTADREVVRPMNLVARLESSLLEAAKTPRDEGPNLADIITEYESK